MNIKIFAIFFLFAIATASANTRERRSALEYLSKPLEYLKKPLERYGHYLDNASYYLSTMTLDHVLVGAAVFFAVLYIVATYYPKAFKGYSARDLEDITGRVLTALNDDNLYNIIESIARK